MFALFKEQNAAKRPRRMLHLMSPQVPSRPGERAANDRVEGEKMKVLRVLSGCGAEGRKGRNESL